MQLADLRVRKRVNSGNQTFVKLVGRKKGVSGHLKNPAVHAPVYVHVHVLLSHTFHLATLVALYHCVYVMDVCSLESCARFRGGAIANQKAVHVIQLSNFL